MSMRDGLCRRCAVAWVAGLGIAVGVCPSAAAQGTSLVSAGDVFKYFKGTQAPPANWKDVAFDDSAWLEGATSIGYGDDDDATTLTDMQNGYLAFFARKSFEVTDVTAIERLTLRMRYDDGFVAYLNGTEIARANLGAAGTAVAFDAPATAGHEEDANPTLYQVALASLRQGTNVLAVELHNETIGSTDATCEPALVANASLAPTGLTCAIVGAAIELDWTNIASYDEIRILRNGIEIATPAPDAVTYTDATADGLDNEYEVVVVAGGEEYSTAACTVACVDARLTCVLELVDGKTQATLSWAGAPAGLSGIEVIREGASKAALDGTATSYVDPNVEDEQPEDDTDYRVVMTRADGRTCTLACGLSLCPVNLRVVVTGNQAELRWESIVKAWDHFEVSRNGVLVDASVPGDATSWTDRAFALEVGATYTYEVHPVAVAGGGLPGNADQCDLTATLVHAPEVASYGAPPGGWDYELQLTTPGKVAYTELTGVAGNLDGEWIRAATDSWDGSAPEEVGPAPTGPAPGGIDVASSPTGAPCGSSGLVLRILDPGNPGTGIGTTYPDPFDAPNNARILLGLDIGGTGTNVLESGVTFLARIRTSPDAPAYMGPNPNSGDGAPPSAGVGHVGVYHRGTTNVGASFAVNSGNDSGDLEFTSNPATEFNGIGVGKFISIWMTVEGGAAADTYDVAVYVNGSTTPSSVVGGTGIRLQTGTADVGAEVSNYILIGANEEGGDSMVEISRLAYKRGVFAPSTTPCGGGEGRFRRGDANDDGTVNITDGIITLNFLFLGGETPPCMDAADTNDDGGVNITDAIQTLNFLFLGGESPAPPGAEACGADPQSDDLEACASTSC